MSMEEAIMEKVQPNEIRIVVKDGTVQDVALGREVARDLCISLTDLDVEGNAAEDDLGVEDNGYGELANCLVLHEPGVRLSKGVEDEDQTVWLGGSRQGCTWIM